MGLAKQGCADVQYQSFEVELKLGKNCHPQRLGLRKRGREKRVTAEESVVSESNNIIKKRIKTKETRRMHNLVQSEKTNRNPSGLNKEDFRPARLGKK